MRKKKRQTEEEVGRQYQRVNSSTRAAENRTRWKGIDMISSLVPPTIFQDYGIEYNNDIPEHITPADTAEYRQSLNFNRILPFSNLLIRSWES